LRSETKIFGRQYRLQDFALILNNQRLRANGSISGKMRKLITYGACHMAQENINRYNRLMDYAKIFAALDGEIDRFSGHGTSLPVCFQ
jgi:hypothetical protein